MKLFKSCTEMRADKNYNGFDYKTLVDKCFERLRKVLDIRRRFSSKYDVLMHTVFEIACKENVLTRVYTKKSEKTGKIRFAEDELNFVLREVENKYGLVDVRPKNSKVDNMLKAIVILAGKYFQVFENCRGFKNTSKLDEKDLYAESPKSISSAGYQTGSPYSVPMSPQVVEISEEQGFIPIYETVTYTNTVSYNSVFSTSPVFPRYNSVYPTYNAQNHMSDQHFVNNFW